ncbi:MAG: hypothetical protein RBR43_10245 [Desulfuromonadaceae bacterium]|nr:hypothetical protein [Desulfuromonadaceae bacterium]
MDDLEELRKIRRRVSASGEVTHLTGDADGDKVYIRTVKAELPSRFSMFKNIFNAMGIAVKTKFRSVGKKEQKRRHSICKNECQWYRAEDDRCSKCGCFTAFKTRLEAWHCPEGKW